MANLSIVNITQKSTLIFGGQGSKANPVQLVNLDPVNTVYIAYASNPMPGQSGVFPIDPLASMSFDGAVSVWGITTASLPVEVGIIPGGTNYSPGSLNISGPVTAEISGPVTVSSITTPVDIGSVSGSVDIASVAGNVDIIGQGGFVTPGQVGTIYNNAGALNIPANTLSSVAQFNVTTFASIVLSVASITNSSVAAGAGVCAIIQLAWQDNNGNNLANDTLSCIIGGSVTWEVPIKGSLLTLELQNVGTVGTITIAATDLFIDGSFRVIPNIRVVNSAILTTPVLTGCTVQVQSKPVYGISSWIANIAYNYSVAVANLVFPLALWSGEAQGFYDIITTALVRNMTIVDLTYAVQGQVVSGSGYAFGVILSIPAAIDTNVVPFNLNLPPTQCAVIADVSAGPGSLLMSLIGVTN